MARLREAPSRAEMPDFSAEGYREAMAERAPHILERWADAGERFEHENRRMHDVRGFFAIEAFGANALGGPRG